MPTTSDNPALHQNVVTDDNKFIGGLIDENDPTSFGWLKYTGAGSVGATDSELRDRATHTGSQVAATISNFNSAVAANDTVAAHTAKLSLVSVTSAVDLDDLDTRVDELQSVVTIKGEWDASSGSFPTPVGRKAGWSYFVSDAGTVDSVTFDVDDQIVALVDDASGTTFSGNWRKLDNSEKVTAVNGRTGPVTGLAEQTSLDTEVSDRTSADNVLQGHIDTLNSENATQQTKLDSIDTGATANSLDSFLLSRANHTGTQEASTISDFVAGVLALIPEGTYRLWEAGNTSETVFTQVNGDRVEFILISGRDSTVDPLAIDTTNATTLADPTLNGFLNWRLRADARIIVWSNHICMPYYYLEVEGLVVKINESDTEFYSKTAIADIAGLGSIPEASNPSWVQIAGPKINDPAQIVFPTNDATGSAKTFAVTDLSKLHLIDDDPTLPDIASELAGRMILLFNEGATPVTVQLASGVTAKGKLIIGSNEGMACHLVGQGDWRLVGGRDS